VKQWFGKPYFVPAKICDGRTNGGITDGDTDHEPEREAAVDNALAELGVFHIFGIEMQRRRIMRQRAEPDIVCFGDGPGNAVLKSLADREFFEIQSWHASRPLLIEFA